MKTCIKTLIDHNIACREPLLKTLEDISPEQFTKDAGVGRTSIRNILVHLADTEKYWISLLRGSKEKSLDPADFKNIQSIRQVWCDIEKETLEYIRDLPEEHLYHVRNVVWGDNTVSFTVGKALIHMATHETHHRGLLIGLIRQLGLQPPDVNML